jgi:hypothetical protein
MEVQLNKIGMIKNILLHSLNDKSKFIFHNFPVWNPTIFTLLKFFHFIIQFLLFDDLQVSYRIRVKSKITIPHEHVYKVFLLYNYINKWEILNRKDTCTRFQSHLLWGKFVIKKTNLVIIFIEKLRILKKLIG